MVGVALVFYQRDIAFGRETVLTASDTDIGGKEQLLVLKVVLKGKIIIKVVY